MSRYIARRLLGAIPLVLGIATLLFFVLSIAPGDPALYFVRPGMTAATIAQLRANFGLDQPLLVRYVKWLGALLQGDFGYSFLYRIPVVDVIRGLLPHTLLLSGSALVLSFLLGIATGVVQAVRHRTRTDSALSALLLFFYSMPSFWLALMLVLVFGVFARSVWHWPFWFPASGPTSADYAMLGTFARILDRIWHLALPVLSLTLVLTAGIARFMRTSMLDVVRQDYIRTARAKGLPERTVVLKHALRNALIPVVTLGGLYIPLLFGGTVFIETVFALPGMGLAIYQAINASDYPLVLGTTFLFATMVVVGNLLADILYAVVDPRIRHG
jgi:peptide/nickel transport system permease protein